MSTPRPFIVRFSDANGRQMRIVCRMPLRDRLPDPPPEEVPGWERWAFFGVLRPGMNCYIRDVVVEARVLDGLGVEAWVPDHRVPVAAVLAAVLGQLCVEAGASEIDLGNIVC